MTRKKQLDYALGEFQARVVPGPDVEEWLVRDLVEARSWIDVMEGDPTRPPVPDRSRAARH